MTLPFDATVAAALDRLAPASTVAADALLTRAYERRRARRLRLTLLAAAAAVVATGAAFAAHELDLLPWLETRNAITSRFTVDPSRIYTASIPNAVRCDGATEKKFECSPTAHDAGARGVYLLHDRAHAYEEVTRQSVLEDIATAKREHSLPAGRAEQMRRDALVAGDDFFERENVLETILEIDATIQDPRRPDWVYVPPRGVPAIVVCTDGSAGSDLSCGDLRGMEGVPAGAPIYVLNFTDDWIKIPLQSEPFDREALRREVFGRELTPAETRLLSSLSLLVVSR